MKPSQSPCEVCRRCLEWVHIYAECQWPLDYSDEPWVKHRYTQFHMFYRLMHCSFSPEEDTDFASALLWTISRLEFMLWEAEVWPRVCFHALDEAEQPGTMRSILDHHAECMRNRIIHFVRRVVDGTWTERLKTTLACWLSCRFSTIKGWGWFEAEYDEESAAGQREMFEDCYWAYVKVLTEKMNS